MTADLEAIPGIAEVQRQRTARIQMGSSRVLIIAAELEKVARRSPRQAVQGDLDEMFKLASAGRGAIASENFATLRHARLGDMIDVPSPSGVLRLPLVGVIREYSDQTGALFIDRSLFTARWRDDTVDFFRVYLDPGVSGVQVKEAILAKFAGNRRIFVLSNEDVRRYVMGLTDQWFTMTWAQTAIAILVAVLGIVNSLTVSVTDRRREFGLLRALGGSRSQVRWTIWMEAHRHRRRQRAARARRGRDPSLLHAGDDLARLPRLALRLSVSVRRGGPAVPRHPRDGARRRAAPRRGRGARIARSRPSNMNRNQPRCEQIALVPATGHRVQHDRAVTAAPCPCRRCRRRAVDHDGGPEALARRVAALSGAASRDRREREDVREGAGPTSVSARTGTAKSSSGSRRQPM